jgi:glycosyltransferase involved in cell wall biosynthesis
MTTGDVDDLSAPFDQIARELDETSPMFTQFIADADVQRCADERMKIHLATANAESAKAQQQLMQTITEGQDKIKAQTQQFLDAIRERDEHIDRLHLDIGRRLDQRRVKMLEAKKEPPPAPKPTVVVIVPYYNGSKFIERAIESIFDQTVPPDEVLVVNDGSREEERAFLYELAKKHPFKIIDKENGGQGSARNAGVAASTSDFISFLDQDDFYLATHIEILTAGIPRDDRHFGWVYADLVEANGDGSVVRTSMVKEHAAHPKKTVVDLIGSDMFILPSASLISRKAFLAVGGFDSQFVGYEDDDLFMRLFRKGFTNYFLDKPVTVWCIHMNSASYTIRMSQSRLQYFKKLMELFPDEPARARFYFRDCLMQRFGPMFFIDALNAGKLNTPLRPEIIKILGEYADAVCKNPSVSWRYKRKMRLAVYLLSNGFPSFLKTAERASKLPILRRIKWCV